MVQKEGLYQKRDISQTKYKKSMMIFCRPTMGAFHNPRHFKPQKCQTPDTSNIRHIKPHTKNIGLSNTPKIKMPFL